MTISYIESLKSSFLISIIFLPFLLIFSNLLIAGFMPIIKLTDHFIYKSSFQIGKSLQIMVISGFFASLMFIINMSIAGYHNDVKILITLAFSTLTIFINIYFIYKKNKKMNPAFTKFEVISWILVTSLQIGILGLFGVVFFMRVAGV